MQVSPETVYAYIYAYPKGELKKLMIQSLRRKNLSVVLVAVLIVAIAALRLKKVSVLRTGLAKLMVVKSQVIGKET
jgi:hypothetical protein